MAPGAAFLDTNVLLYLFSADEAKADRCEALLAQGAVIGAQVLNELTSVARKKLAMSWREIADVLGLIRMRCVVTDLTVVIHDSARALAARHRLSWYDALIVAAALDSGSRILYSEDLQHGLEVERTLQIRNPFQASR